MKALSRSLKIVTIFLLVLFIYSFRQSHTWFFLHTGQHRIDFSDVSGVFDPLRNLAHYEGTQIPVPAESLVEDIAAQKDASAAVLGETTGSEKRIEVDLTNQRLYAFKGNRKVFDFVISTGKPWWATPTGKFRIWIKLRYKRMRGGSRALGTYYDLPNVPYVMFFENKQVPGWRGYGIHGTYWHNNFGQPMSHGCVNLRTEDAARLYYWANPDLHGYSSIRASHNNPGTQIVIYGQTPGA